MRRRRVQTTRLQQLGCQVCQFNTPDGTIHDITYRMGWAVQETLQLAWIEILSRIMRLERAVQNHRVRSSLRWLRRWEVLCVAEMERRRNLNTNYDVEAVMSRWAHLTELEREILLAGAREQWEAALDALEQCRRDIPGLPVTPKHVLDIWVERIEASKQLVTELSCAS